jgi:hypothetical protein
MPGSAVSGTTVHWVNTMEALQAINTSNIADCSPAILDGFVAANDGGGGMFVWRATSTEKENGGTVVRPNSIRGQNPGRWVRLYDGAINVRWFGAGLGAADDAPFVQQAIETAIHVGVPGSNSFGSTVYFPAGNYNVQQPIYIETSDVAYQGWISVKVTGDGKFNTHIILRGPYSTAFIFGGLSQSGNPQGPGWRLRHCEISNLSIEQPSNPISIGPPWSIVGVGDMNGNGKADIVWYNSQTGETQVWYMDGHRRVDRGTVLGEDGNPIFIGPPWSIVGVGDMNGNGKADIVWYNSVTHETQVWYMDGHRRVDRGTVLGQDGNKERLDGAIKFLGGGIGFLVMNVAMYGVWCGITCNATKDSYTWRAKIQNVHMEGVLNAGIYARFAINWDVSNTYIGCRNYFPIPPPQGTAGIWLDTRTEGWMFTVIETGGFDSGLRMTNGYPQPSHDRPPDTHQFVQCNFDAGSRACIWLTNSHRCRFQGCYASSSNATLTGVVVLDSADVYGFEWVDSVILNAHNHCFWISDATSFSIMDSTFATWGKNETNIGTYDAITVAGARTAAAAHMSFIITGNTFINDPDFPANLSNQLKPIKVQGSPFQFFQKFIVTNNISYGAKMVPSTNDGTAVTGQKVFSNNF